MCGVAGDVFEIGLADVEAQVGDGEPCLGERVVVFALRLADVAVGDQQCVAHSMGGHVFGDAANVGAAGAAALASS